MEVELMNNSDHLDQNNTQVAFFDAYAPGEEEALFEFADFDDEALAGLLDFEEVPLLLVDTDPERAVSRQKELMDYCFGGIGEERKEEKRMGLAMQMLDIEQRHALRLLLIYQDVADLAAHLKRCLADPAYGYGERGDQGRTIAQAMAAMAREGDMDGIVTAWFQAHQPFRQRVLSGRAFSFRSLFDFATLDTFAPVVQRVGAASRAEGRGDMTWRLGVEGDGKFRDFQGEMAKVWPELCDTYVEWSDTDNEAWLNDLKRKADRLPDTIQRVAWADRLGKERRRIEVKGNQVILTTERPSSAPSTSSGSFSRQGDQDWPRSITLGDQIGLSRLSGHAFYELAWAGGLHVRRFELSSTTRNRLPVEHIELAHRLAEALGTEQGLAPDPVTPAEIEAAYLRRMKLKRAELGPPEPGLELPAAIQGQPLAIYQAGNVLVMLLRNNLDFAYATSGDAAILLRRDDKRGILAALPVARGRVRREPLLTTPLAELDFSQAAARRALCAWAAWLVWVLK
jgi:hypothetical protein